LSPYALIYETLGSEAWPLLVAAFVQSNVIASVAPVLIRTLLKRFPTPTSCQQQLEDVLSLPECKFVPKLPWILMNLKKVAEKLALGEKVSTFYYLFTQ